MVGNTPNFTKIDILRCFFKVDKNKGRQDLARELELGEGTVRTILDLLKSKQLLYSTKKGHFLTKKGDGVLKSISERISMPKNVTIKNIYPDVRKVGVLIKNSPHLKEFYKFRDIAVKNKADGAIILKFDKKLYTPESDYKQDYSELEKYFDLKDNDTLVIVFSSKNQYAENGALAIAVEMDEFIKKFINQF